MQKMWEFFEALDEMVYASDLETHELIYMNRHLRTALGYDKPEEYVGKKCYEVLQGGDAPCAFCTNKRLEAGEFVSWTHKNPVLGKRYLVKDSVVWDNGRPCRIEIAIDIDSEVVCKTPYYYARSETILNECLRQIVSGTDPEEAIRHLLAYLGQTFACDRVYIFEFNSSEFTRNTYEWCGENVEAQQDVLQDVGLSGIDWWLDAFSRNEVVVVQDLEEIRADHPEAYAILKPQGITSLAVGPITMDGHLAGFLGVDNPDKQMLTLIAPLLNVIGYFVASLLKRRELLCYLSELSYHDQLTGALNRNALAEYYGHLPMESVGVIYCDITALKQINDTMGHEAGDKAICHCYELIRSALGTEYIYRSGGDEFIVLCPDYSEEQFKGGVTELQKRIAQDEHHIAVGYVWSDEQPLDFEKLITRADQVMYRDKRGYYRKRRLLSGAVQKHISEEQQEQEYLGSSLFQNFFASTHFDVEALFQSLSQNNASSYFYFGDMEQDLFYISDNMRDDFGFSSNVVPHLLQQWSKRISTPEFQDLFWQDISGMLREKRTLHDLRYRVRDVHGNNQWIRCYGLLKWDEEKTRPLFFSGRVTHQDMDFVIDPISNLPRDHTAYSRLSELEGGGEKALIIGFSLNGITVVNSTKGRSYADRLLKRIAEELMEKLSWKMSFYRLEGMRCMAVVNPICRTEGQDVLVDQIRTIVRECYESMGISVPHACSFGLMEYPYEGFTPEDLVENLISLIRVAKQETKQNYVEYSAQSIQQIKQMSNMALALSQDVARGMEHFRIVIQPVVSAGDGKAIGGEVLLRWSFEGRDISPGVFIPILERENLIHAAGRWVFERAVSTCVRIHAYDPTFYLTFNVSLHQLSDTHLLDFMRETLEKYHLDGSHLVAELTESCLDEQPEKLANFVHECQKMGVYIALDDFGSGYSSLRMLLQYPSSIIKLDRSLVQEVTESEEKMNFIRSIVFACHQFGKTVCMEGVEREDQNSIIRDTGCDMIQGYYYYRPMELSDIYRLISREME